MVNSPAVISWLAATVRKLDKILLQLQTEETPRCPCCAGKGSPIRLTLENLVPPPVNPSKLRPEAQPFVSGSAAHDFSMPRGEEAESDIDGASVTTTSGQAHAVFDRSGNGALQTCSVSGARSFIQVAGTVSDARSLIQATGVEYEAGETGGLAGDNSETELDVDPTKDDSAVRYADVRDAVAVSTDEESNEADILALLNFKQRGQSRLKRYKFYSTVEMPMRRVNAVEHSDSEDTEDSADGSHITIEEGGTCIMCGHNGATEIGLCMGCFEEEDPEYFHELYGGDPFDLSIR